MNAVRIETTIEADGELHLTRLPFRQGDRVEAIVLVLDKIAPASPVDSTEGEARRQAALERLQKRVDASRFHSAGPSPRDELHERH